MKQKFALFIQMMRRWRVLTDDERAVLSATGSTAANLLLGVGKLVLGVLLASPWFAINAVYYVLLGVARGSAVLYCGAVFREQNPAVRTLRQKRAGRFGGVFLVLLGVCYLLISVRMYFREESTTYAWYILFAVVLITFCKIVFSVRGLLFCSHKRDPVIRLIRKFSFADACVSLVTIRCALLLLTDAPNAIRNSAFFGILVSVILVGMGVGSVVRDQT